jgi:20S proteasome subunit alpha 2
VTEKRSPSILVDEESIEKIAIICDNIGMVYAGMGPDARVLVVKARKAAQAYKRTYGEYPPVFMLVKEVAAVMQEYTQSGGVRPFGVSLLIIGVDQTGPSLYQVDPSGAFWAWKASTIGKNMINANSFLEKRYSEDLEIEDAVHTAILTLKEGFEGQMTAENIQIGVANVDSGKFEILNACQVQDYLNNLA